MTNGFRLPQGFEERLGVPIKNARERLEEAVRLGSMLTAAAIPLKTNPDHFALFTDPPRLLSGGLKRLGYITGADHRCYPSPVDGCDYINVAASLPASSPLREEGWPDHVAVVHPVDEAGHARMLEQNYGNPFLHHVTFGIPLPELPQEEGLSIARKLVGRMVEIREKIASVFEEQPGTLVIALPKKVRRDPEFVRSFQGWIGDIPAEEYQLEEMEGGGYLLQFFVLCGGRIEVALRFKTRQVFNPKSVHKISEDELSVDQGPGE